MGLKSVLDKIWPWFQTTADKIKAWELPPKVDELFDEIWDNLPSTIQDTIYKMLKSVYEKYGEEFAKELLEKILALFKKSL